MALKLKKRALPSVKFERDNLPVELADEGAEACFIKIEARAAGPINPEYVSAIEDVSLNIRVMRAKSEAKDDPEDRVRFEDKGVREAMRQRCAALYDSCVISWETNVADAGTDKPIAPNRDNFLALFDVRIPEIADALSEFERECVEAGQIIADEDEETGKN
jgi:hypothetical protein